jgi:hypothetical protein
MTLSSSIPNQHIINALAKLGINPQCTSVICHQCNDPHLRYLKQSLVIRGRGSSSDVTAGGVFGDLLRLVAYLALQGTFLGRLLPELLCTYVYVGNCPAFLLRGRIASVKRLAQAMVHRRLLLVLLRHLGHFCVHRIHESITSICVMNFTGPARTGAWFSSRQEQEVRLVIK